MCLSFLSFGAPRYHRRGANWGPGALGHLDATAGAPRELWVALDRYHDRRNAAEYHGAVAATDAEAKDLVKLAAKLQKLALDWLKSEHPELLK